MASNVLWFSQSLNLSFGVKLLCDICYLKMSLTQLQFHYLWMLLQHFLWFKSNETESSWNPECKPVLKVKKIKLICSNNLKKFCLKTFDRKFYFIFKNLKKKYEIKNNQRLNVITNFYKNYMIWVCISFSFNHHQQQCFFKVTQCMFGLLKSNGIRLSRVQNY